MSNAQFFIDTDAGVDDILALFLLCALVPDSLIDVAVTFGNVPLDQAIQNVWLFSRISGFKPSKIFRGHAAPLCGEPHYALDVHGRDGLGGISYQYREATDHITTYDLSLVEHFSLYEKVVAIGPLTDIAVLARGALSSPTLFVMGGAFEVPGNITEFAEFNFYSDADAALEVFDTYNADIFVIPLDVCNQVVLGRNYLNDLCNRFPTPTTSFVRSIHQHYMKFYNRREGIDGCHPHDAIAVYAALFSDMFVWEPGRVRVVVENSERGRSLFTPHGEGRHHVARGFDPSRFFAILEDAMARHVQSP